MKPSIPKGTRDFSPEEMVKRNYIFDTIRSVYQLFGFVQIETPAMERTDTLMGKYGEEGDKLIFKILNSGDFLDKVDDKVLAEKNSNAVANQLSEKALRYDLTVPFARYVVQHQNEITFPFKRYQIQPVWRADRPQKGRFREFYQCDADIIGSDSILNEAELIRMIDTVFTRLGLKVEILINNRKILYGIAQHFGVENDFEWFVNLLDRYEKIGPSVFRKELEERMGDYGESNKVSEIAKFLNSNSIGLILGNYDNIIENMSRLVGDSEIGKKGISELQTLINFIKPKEWNDEWLNGSISDNTQVFIDYSLARGLNYYTGAIIEVKAKYGDFKSSICGGGRYDDLTGIFGLPNVSGVGISFGADRIYVVMDEAGLFPEFKGATTQVMFVNFGEKEEAYCLPLVAKLRAAGINTEIYPESAKMKKQMTYANNKNIPYVVLVGESEMQSGQLSVKDMQAGTQDAMSINELVGKLK